MTELLSRTEGNIAQYEQYILSQVEMLYVAVPEGPAKAYASYLADPANYEACSEFGSIELCGQEYRHALQEYCRRCHE